MYVIHTYMYTHSLNNWLHACQATSECRSVGTTRCRVALLLGARQEKEEEEASEEGGSLGDVSQLATAPPARVLNGSQRICCPVDCQ